jgi:hypothetical protein
MFLVYTEIKEKNVPQLRQLKVSFFYKSPSKLTIIPSPWREPATATFLFSMPSTFLSGWTTLFSEIDQK